jgi:transcriptional regulator with XRE-family HTH domain
MNAMSALAETLRMRRAELGLSQAELAAACGVGQQTISRWETGQGVPPPPRVVRLAEVLTVDAEHLHTLAGYLPQRERSPLSGPFQALYARSAELSTEELWLLCDRLWEELRRRQGIAPARGLPGQGKRQH